MFLCVGAAACKGGGGATGADIIFTRDYRENFLKLNPEPSGSPSVVPPPEANITPPFGAAKSFTVKT